MYDSETGQVTPTYYLPVDCSEAYANTTLTPEQAEYIIGMKCPPTTTIYLQGNGISLTLGSHYEAFTYIVDSCTNINKIKLQQGVTPTVCKSDTERNTAASDILIDV